ncbi:hypothetical protein [Candidatus Nitrospira bockiana]
MTIIEAIEDRNLFRPFFRDLTIWSSWLTFLKALFALQMTEPELLLYRQLTGRQHGPTSPAEEAWLVVGRRGGKSFIVALIAVYLAAFRSYEQYLQRGERGTVVVIATDRRQARIVMRYVLTLIDQVPMLADLVMRKEAESIDLSNRITIEIHTASFRTVRGYTIVAAILDEIAFWFGEDYANPDSEIVAAVRPAMATIPGALLLGLSSPYRRSGVLYEAYRRHFGQDDDPILVLQAGTRIMNPTIPERVISSAYERDPIGAAAEYGAEFRSDVAGFLSPDWIDRAVLPGRHELPPAYAVNGQAIAYRAFADPSGGGRDAFTLAIAHQEGESVVLDMCRGRRPPFDPSSVVADFAALLKQYRCFTVVGDRYAGEWVVEAFRKHGITYRPAELSKSELYLEAEPLFATGAARILDQRTLHTELLQLERRAGRAGRDSVDHPPGAHDDFANAACGALVEADKAQRQVARMVKLIGF